MSLGTYTCMMHPEVKSDKPGKCPKCGMELVKHSYLNRATVVNDAPALAQADIGIAVGSGSDIAAETAGIILVNSNPKDIASLILFGKATYRKMIQNLIWATGYNVVAIPLAAGVLYKWGILLTPAVGAVFMSVSTIVVAINAKMLRVKTVSKKN